MPTPSNDNLPVIIVGAGPCGLIAAVALKKYNVPFVIIERASRSKICSNAGSGFELAPTSVTIFNRLGVDVSELVSIYKGLSVLNPDGKLMRNSTLSVKAGSVNRAHMQNVLLEMLFPSPKDEEGVLLCGSGLETYREEVEESADGGRVVATLTSGETITGCVLLACDGIHSRVRAVMHGGYDSTKDWETNVERSNELDPLHFCDTIVYWGKTPLQKGSLLEEEFTKTQGIDGKVTSFVFSLTSPKVPANIYMIPAQDATVINWAITVASKEQSKSKSNDGSDLTRRGGGPLTEEEKARLFDFTNDGSNTESVIRGMEGLKVLEELIRQTDAKNITEAGLFDRENLDLPFASESNLVALLGDSAHPQTPLLGQGVNMAITDAYIYATNIAVSKKNKKSPREAILKSTTAQRHKSSKSTVKMARFMCKLFTSQNRFVCWLMYLVCKYSPVSFIVGQVDDSDKSNSDFLKFLDESCCTPKEQEVLKV